MGPILGRHLSGVAIADTPDFGPKPWISLATVIWRMRPILVHLSWGYRAGINQIPVCVDSRCGSRPGSKVAHERGSSVLTMTDIEQLGAKGAAERALEIAWKNAKAVYLSFDIDSIDPGFAPGTGTPEPGGLYPREALEMVRLIAREGLCGMEVVEVSPPYDVNDNTAQLACRLILDVLGTMVVEGKLGHRDRAMKDR